MHKLQITLLAALAFLCLAVLAAPSRGRAAEPAPQKPDPAAVEKAVHRAAEFLRTKKQEADGSYVPATGPGVTAVVTAALLRNGYRPDDPAVAKSLKYLEGMVRDDGGIYAKKSDYRNYETCLGVLCFSEANGDGRYTKVLKGAEAFLKHEQWGGPAHSVDQTDPAYGGAGYGKHQRPDLSNTQFFLDALKAAGDGPDDPAVKKALVFVSRCQNLESEHNTTGMVKEPDGGFYYTAAAGGQSMADKTGERALRSYGSMTYAGLKSMIYAGVGPDDPRVKAAFQWIRKHYDVRANPGMGSAGLYYYYHTFAKALDAMKLDAVEDSAGVKHVWRDDLAAELLRRQKADGSWINDTPRWMEGEPALVTGYALLTLAYCRPAK
jgi:squalene-hopene/tetraprenyl-beta-curcumene cyclase